MTQPSTFISIDQNSHSLWDTLPKLEVLSRRGISGTHLLEDIDTAFTRRGAKPGDKSLELARERVYRDGSLDWGAALFYSDFLGRTPVDVREIETYLGASLKSLAKKAGKSVEGIFADYGASDNWQLIGTSYAQDELHHRTVGDLRISEVAPFLHQLVDHAEENLAEVFPENAAQLRIGAWFAAEKDRLQTLLGHCGNAPLTQLYHAWLEDYLRDGPVSLGYTSNHFQLDATACQPASPLIQLIIEQYHAFAECYNRAVSETSTGIAPLDIEKGELPLFAVWRHEKRLVRSPVFLTDNELQAGNHSWPLNGDGSLPAEQMQRHGVAALAGKALVLALQVRLPPCPAPLVLPYNGSLYMPAAHRLSTLLQEQGLLTTEPLPIYRVRFRLLERMREVGTLIALPQYLHEYMSASTLPADEVAANLPQSVARATQRLEALKNKSTRDAEVSNMTPELSARIRELEEKRRELAMNPATRSQAGEIWNEAKDLRRQQTLDLMQGVVNALHVTNIDYWDSRGALLPWCVALGGEKFYNSVIDNAEIYAETP